MIHIFFESIQNFLHQGGWVLYVIFFNILALWILILERFWYFYIGFHHDIKPFLEKWKRHSHSDSLAFRKFCKADLSLLNRMLNKNLAHIKTLISLCPLMGLLGTVTGMITVFEIMAEVGIGSTRLMTSGVSMAIIPTMAGMVGALSGIYTIRILENHTKKKEYQILHWIADALA